MHPLAGNRGRGARGHRQEAHAQEPDHAGLLFITKYGIKWAQAETSEPDETGKRKMWSDDAVGKEFTKLVKALGLHRPGLSFYAIRHTFETIGGASRDQVAVDYIMGHARDDMASATASASTMTAYRPSPTMYARGCSPG